ncbi:hypothetical protein Tco_0688554 [Tanacetum coccineum]
MCRCQYCVFKARSMQQPDPTQGAAGILQGTCTCKKLKGKSVVNDASSACVAAKNEGKKFSNRWKMVRGSKSSSSFNNRTSNEKVYSCTSCPLKFSKQTALAGHRNLHKSEYVPLLNGKIQRQKWQLSTRHKLFLRPLLLRPPRHPLSKPTNILERPSASAPRNPMVNPIITQEQTWTYAHGISLAKPTSNLKGSSPGYPLADPANMLKHMSSCNSLARSKDVLPGPSSMPPLANPAYTLKHPSDSPLRALLGTKYKGVGHTDVPLKSLQGSSSSLESQAGSSSDAHEDLSHGGKGTRSLFPVTPAQGIHNHHSVQSFRKVLVQQVDVPMKRVRIDSSFNLTKERIRHSSLAVITISST